MGVQSKRIDLTGHVYGRLTVIEFSHVVRDGRRHHVMWRCRCECGNEHTARSNSLRTGALKSCGCFKTEVQTKHGMNGTPEYGTFHGMLDRCYNPNNDRYHRYGGRGIKVCDEWLSNQKQFYIDMGPKPDGHSIERINNDGNYCKENCRWATPKEQADNRSTNRNIDVDGVILNVTRWAEKIEVSPQVIDMRVHQKGLDVTIQYIRDKINKKDNL